jgi:hypothetical protein
LLNRRRWACIDSLQRMNSNHLLTAHFRRRQATSHTKHGQFIRQRCRRVRCLFLVYYWKLMNVSHKKPRLDSTYLARYSGFDHRYGWVRPRFSNFGSNQPISYLGRYNASPSMYLSLLPFLFIGLIASHSDLVYLRNLWLRKHAERSP